VTRALTPNAVVKKIIGGGVLFQGRGITKKTAVEGGRKVQPIAPAAFDGWKILA